MDIGVLDIVDLEKVENGRPKISVEKIIRISQLFGDDSRLPLLTVAAEFGVDHRTVWHFLGKNLKRNSYKLRMSTELTENHKTERKQFA